MSHERLSFVHGDIRDAALVRELVGGRRRDRQRGGRVARREVDRGGRLRVRDDERRGHADPARRDPRDAGRALHPHLLERGVRHGRVRDPMDERHPLKPRSPYAATKAGGDRLAYSYFVTYGLPIVIVRPFNNYGPRQHPEKVVPRFITQALAGEPLTIHGDGHASRDWLYVDDHAEAIEALIDAPLDDVAGEVVNVATGVDISVTEIADLVLDAVGEPDGAEGARRRAARPGRPPHRLDGQDRAALTGWRARDGVRGRARADRRLVPRERGLVAGRPRARRRLLVLGAGPAQLGLLEAARGARDLHVIAVDRDPRRAGLRARGRARRHLVGGRGRRSTGSRAPRDVDGIISPGADWPVGIAARVAERLGAAAPDRRARRRSLATTKTRQRERVRRGRRAAAARRARPARRRELPFPCVVKAPDRQGQRGLTLVRAPAELEAARRGRARRVPRRRRARRGARRRARGDGQRRLARRALPPAHRDRPR